MAHRRFMMLLGGLFAIVWAALSIRPLYRADWLLENFLVMLFVPLLVATSRRFPFSRVSYVLIFLFLCLHEVGAHYTYAKVPYDAWFQVLTGDTLNFLLGWQSNHFDRFRGQMVAVASSIMGSGWAALAWEPLSERLLITQIYDHQSNLNQGGVPLMVMDAWEHAYYLQYRATDPVASADLAVLYSLRFTRL